MPQSVGTGTGEESEVLLETPGRNGNIRGVRITGDETMCDVIDLRALEAMGKGGKESGVGKNQAV